jgi:hypothetical protein
MVAANEDGEQRGPAELERRHVRSDEQGEDQARHQGIEDDPGQRLHACTEKPRQEESDAGNEKDRQDVRGKNGKKDVHALFSSM